MNNNKAVNSGVMLNVYPDSIGENLGGLVEFLKLPELKELFSSIYILPSLYNSDLDRGFSVIDYGINEMLASRDDLEEIKGMGIDLKLDFILNHASVLSKQFMDILDKGRNSRYADFFIDWNRFWEGCGEMTEDGYIQPDNEYIKDMFFRKPGLPILMVRMPDGTRVPYWNTFYQEVSYEEVDAQTLLRSMDIQYGSAVALAELLNCGLRAGKKPCDIEFGRFERYREQTLALMETRERYLGQMDLNVASPLVWDFYGETLDTLAEYGASIVRLDAFAYADKKPGTRNFMNEPGTWDILDRLRKLAGERGLNLLLEIHSAYEEKSHEAIAEKAYMIYDFFLPGLLIHAIETSNVSVLAGWAREQYDKKMPMVNMLGCHDGIPMLDLKGLVPDDEIQAMIDLIVGRGGYIKNLHGQKNVYYQVNATYFSALGEDERKLLLARAVQMFMPGKPQLWYLDLFAGVNDHEAVEKAGPGGHKEINRTNLTLEYAKKALPLPRVQKQLELIHFRNSFPAFGFDSKMAIKQAGKNLLEISWEQGGYTASLKADFSAHSYEVSGRDEKGSIIKFHS